MAEEMRRGRDWNAEETKWQAWFHTTYDDTVTAVMKNCVVELPWCCLLLHGPGVKWPLRENLRAWPGPCQEHDESSPPPPLSKRPQSECQIFQPRFVYLHVRLNPTWVSVAPATDCNLWFGFTQALMGRVWTVHVGVRALKVILNQSLKIWSTTDRDREAVFQCPSVERRGCHGDIWCMAESISTYIHLTCVAMCGLSSDTLSEPITPWLEDEL